MFLFGDQGKTALAWPHSRDSLAELTRNCTFAWPFSSVSRVSPWREISVPWKTAEGAWKSCAAKGNSAVGRWNGKLSERWQRAVERNGDDVVQF